MNSLHYFCCHITVSEMLQDRGYDVVVPSSNPSDYDEFVSRFGKQLDLRTLGFRVSHLSDPSNTIDELLQNVRKYEAFTNDERIMTSKCEVLTDDEVLAMLNLEENELPTMLNTNDIARYYALERGQVVKINRSAGLLVQ